jgi:acetoin utilization deacetylase AcuC-like enzyme
LILDWDVHHGNGTEEIFAASSSVFYASIHQWPLYPGTGAASMRGTGAGEGYTLNMPVPAGSGNERFVSLVEDVVVPAAREFRPGLLAISAGYDAHRDDPLASCLVDEDGYGRMTELMRDAGAELGAPVLVCLEGGYDADALAASVVRTIATLG